MTTSRGKLALGSLFALRRGGSSKKFSFMRIPNGPPLSGAAAPMLLGIDQGSITCVRPVSESSRLPRQIRDCEASNGPRTMALSPLLRLNRRIASSSSAVLMSADA
jgi:hypothetical protein